jgi:hypothetical protein
VFKFAGHHSSVYNRRSVISQRRPRIPGEGDGDDQEAARDGVRGYQIINGLGFVIRPSSVI